MISDSTKNVIYIVGLGPGDTRFLTEEARSVLEASDVIVGYNVYVDLIRDSFPDKEYQSTGMRQELERCRLCYKLSGEGKVVSLVCSGDAGIYGLASLMYEIGQEYDNVELSVIPGITAANSGAAVLGAPLNHDFCTISLSDLLTPWDKIEKRLVAAAEGDFVIALYNPSSHKRKDYLMRACDILLRAIEPDRACGYVENIGREGTSYTVCTLGELRSAQVNMFTTVFIGNEGTQIIDGKLVTKRGYQIE